MDCIICGKQRNVLINGLCYKCGRIDYDRWLASEWYKSFRSKIKNG